MSSFTIDKKEYVKAAGIIAGIAEASSAGSGIHQLWLYDYETGRNSTEADYYRRFVECFEMNALSVAEQYHDSAPYTDSADYMPTFNRAVQFGKQLYIVKGDKLKKAIMELRHFFSSAIYQTENMAYMMKMKFFFYQIEDQLMKYLYPVEDLQSCGSLELVC